MKSKRYIFTVVFIIILSAMFVGFYIQHSKLDGSTFESRELILNKSINGSHIYSEIKIDDYIISGIIANNNKYGLAVFNPKANRKYDFQSSALGVNGKTIVEHILVGNLQYDLFWRNQADLDYAEIIYTEQGKNPKTIRLDAKDNKILYCEAPSNDYSIKAIYYDIHGEKYE